MRLWPCLFILPCIVMYLLYIKGFVASRYTRAILFRSWQGKDADKVTLDSCTGWTRRVGRFHESRTYHFALNSQLSKGDVEVVLLDKKKRQLLKLDQQSPTGRIELDGKKRYYLRWKFESATGKCELRW